MIFSTIYSKNVLNTREEKQLILDDVKKSIEACKNKLSADRYILAPSTEALNRFFLENKLAFEEIDCEIPLVEKDLYENISDKYKFGEMCKTNNILIPKEYQSIHEIQFPYVAKPKKYFTDKGRIYTPFLIHNEKEKQDFIDKCNPKDFFLQEFIKGKCLYLLYYFYKNGTVAKFSQSNKIQQPGGKSMLAAESSDFHEGNESLKYEKLFKQAGFFGLVMVETKEADGECYMIEANPRFWGPSQLFVDSDINLFEAFLFDNNLLDNKPEYISTTKKIKYFWYGGLVESMKKFNYIVYHDYSKERFDEEYFEWASSDIYNRDDTKVVFEQEISTICLHQRKN